MKKLFFLILISNCFLSVYPQISRTMRFYIADFEMRDTLCPDNETYIYFPDKFENTLHETGKAALPVKLVRLLLPTGAVVDSITAFSSDTTIFELTHKVFPYQSPIPINMNMEEAGFENPDSVFYSSELPYPGTGAELDGIGYWHKANIVTLSVCPFQYTPGTNKLVFTTNVSINISFRESTSYDSTHKIKMKANTFANYTRTLSGMVENPESIQSYLKETEIINGFQQVQGLCLHDYVVVVPDEYANATPLNTFIDWKKRKGIDIGIVYLSEVYNYAAPNYIQQDDIGNTTTLPNNQSISDNQAKIRKYLKEIHDNGGCHYVLLVGDHTKIPVRKYYADHGYYQNTTPADVKTDKYYADFTSDYAVDGDTRWGEITSGSSSPSGDKVDTYPETFVGRVPCSTIQELEVWVNKLLNYETDPGNGDADYLNCFVMNMADEPQSYIRPFTFTNLNFFNPLQKYQETPSWNYPDPTAPDGSEIIGFLNASPSGWWTWDNHGASNEFAVRTHSVNCGTMSSINSTNSANGILSLSNLNKYGIVSSNCCNVANYEMENSMVDASIFNNQGGSVAFSGNTNLGWTDICEGKLFEISGILNSYHNNFGSNYGFDPFLKRVCPAEWKYYTGINPFIYYRYESYMTANFFGDPEMMYYTKNPPRIAAKVTPQHIDLTANNSIQVTISNLGTNNTALVCLYKPASSNSIEFQKTITVSGSSTGNAVATFSIVANELTKGKLYVTITAFDMLPYTNEIVISPGCAYDPNATEHIIGTAFPWTQIRFLDHDVIIDNLGTLTITGEAYFVPGAKLIVKPGGKLIIDNGKLASSCENLWEGVEAWGNNGQMQNVLNQGSVLIINGGSICDAICGISTKQPEINNNHTGGIVSCNNASFVNNKIAVKFYPFYYQGHGYNSSFSNCNFLLNDNYLGQALNATPEGMVYMNGVYGILFRGCLFDNSITTNTNISSRGYGIKSYNGGYSVDRLCTSAPQPCETYLKSSFKGLSYGIHSSNTGYMYPIAIQNTEFDNNYRAVYMSGLSLPQINRNTFKTRTGSSNYATSGLYLNACTGYSVQENTFEGNISESNPITFETGFVINNCGTAPNEIYNNSFTKLQNGITAQDDNRGLVCKCNDYSNVKTDQSVLITGGSSNTIGISLYQGDGLSVSGPAGNTFSLRTSGTGDIYNQGVKFNYYHHQNIGQYRLKPEFYEKVDLAPYNYENYTKQAACPSKLGGGGGINQEQIKDELVSADNLIEQKQDSLAALIDGGNTEETTEDVVYSSPLEALDLRDALLSKSPYLSDTVMQSAVTNEYVLPNAMIRDILVANPQSSASDPVLDKLDQRIDPMPDEMYNQILDGEFLLSPKETKEAELASLNLVRETNYNTLVSYYLADTTGTLADSLEQLLMNENKPEARYQLACKQLSEGDTAAAGSTLATIPTTFNLTPVEMVQHENYLSYFAVVTSMDTDTLPGYECDSLQVAALTLLMQQGYEPVSSYARNLLIANGAVTYNEPYLVGNEMKSARVIRERRNVTSQLVPKLTLSPNPCRNFVIAGYSLENNSAQDAFLTISTLQGTEIKTIRLIGAKDQVVISLNNFSPGLYVASLKAGGKLMDNKKIIIVK
jgi:hypothetical protein